MQYLDRVLCRPDVGIKKMLLCGVAPFADLPGSPSFCLDCLGSNQKQQTFARRVPLHNLPVIRLTGRMQAAGTKVLG